MTGTDILQNIGLIVAFVILIGLMLEKKQPPNNRNGRM